MAAIPLGSSAYTQNFDTLVNTGTSSAFAGALDGWALAETGSAANTTYTAGTGSLATGDSYSFGSAASTDRAFGGLQSGSLVPTIGAQFTNANTSAITQLNIGYNGEQWRLGTTARADRLDFQYSLDATSLTTGTWTDVNTLDFTAPVTAGTLGALDGNAAANRTAISGSIASLSISVGSTFWIRWNDFNASGADDGLGVDDFSISAVSTLSAPTVTSPTSANIGTNSATLGGNVTNDGGATITERGVVYSLTGSNNDPLIGGSNVTKVTTTGTTGIFTIGVSGLTANSGYSFKAYAINSQGTTYTSVATFSTLAAVSAPTVTSPTSTGITDVAATLGGDVSSDGGSPITERGVIYSLTSANGDPQIGGSGVTKVTVAGTTGVFTTNVTGLTASSGYSFKAYAINAIGTSYTSVATFTTNAPTSAPILAAPTSPVLADVFASLAGNITSDGGATLTERGFVYSVQATNANPQIGGTGVTKVVATGTATGAYSRNTGGLQPNTTYAFASYAINAIGTGYSVVGSFTTSSTNVLSAGDFVFTGYDGLTSPERVSFVALKSITAGTTISLTDNGFDGSAAIPAFTTNEGTAALYFSQAFPAGSHFYFDGTAASFFNADNSTTGLVSAVLSGSLALSNTGDQATIFQGALTNPASYLGQVSSGAFISSGAPGTNSTWLAPGLTVGDSAITLNAAGSNGVLDSTKPAIGTNVTGSASAIRALIENISNWSVATTALTVPPAITFTLGLVTPSVTATPATKVYDGAAIAITSTADDGAGGAAADTNAAHFSYTYYAGPNLTGGTLGSAPVNAGSYSVAIAYAGNVDYNPVASTTFNFTITPVALTVTAVADSKTYDGTTAATISYSGLSGFVGTETVTVGAGTGTFASANAAAGIAVTANAPVLSNGTNGGLASNYTLATPTGLTATISPKALTATAVAGNKTYDGTTTASIAYSGLTGFVGSETVTVSGSGTFASKDVGTAIAVTAGTPVLANGTNGGLAANYSLATPTGLSADISAKALSVTAVANSKVFDGTDAATITYSALTGFVGSETVTVTTPGTGTFAQTAVGTGIAVTANAPILNNGTNGGLASNYSLATPTGLTADILAAPVTPTITTSPSTKVYDGAAFAITVSASASGNPTDSQSNLTTSGTFGNFTIQFYTGSTTGSSTSATAMKNVGTYAFTVAYAGNVNYTAVGVQTFTYTVTPKALTVTAVANNKAFDGTTAATISYSGLTGFAGTETVTVTTPGTGTFAQSAPGTGIAVTADAPVLNDGTNGGLATNYSLATPTGLSADITLLVTPTIAGTPSSKVYDAANFVLSVSASASGSPTDSQSNITTSGTFGNFTVQFYAGATTASSTSATSLKNAGTYAYTVTYAGNVNFNSVATQTFTYTVTPKALTATATASSKVYDGTTAATITYTGLTGFVGAETVTVGAGSGTFASKNVANAIAITANAPVLSSGTNGGLASNYSLATPTGLSANITQKALTATATANSKVYDKTTAATISYTITAGLVGTETVTASGAGTFATSSVGTGIVVTPSAPTLANGTNGGLASNYSLATPGSLSANITKKNLVIAGFTVDTKVYDQTTTATVQGSPSLTGVIPGDTVNLLGFGGSFTFNNKNVGTGKPVSQSGYSLTGTSASNYSLDAVIAATGTITAKALTVTSSAASRVYDGTTSATVTIGLTGVIAGDTVTGSATGTFANKNVGNGKTVTVGTVTLAGADAGNYSAGAAPTATANITAKALTAASSAASKVYDGTTAATVTIVLTGVVSGDAVTGSASGTFNNKNIGTAKPVTVGTVSLTGTDAGNYTVGAAPGATANITAKSLTATATAASKVYDGNTSAVVTVGLTGVISGETVTASAPGTFDTKNVGTAKPVTVGSVTLAGVDAGNYTVSSAPNTTADITAKALAVSSSAANKVYDGNANATVTIGLTGVVSGDTVSGSATGTFDNKNVGTSKVVTVGTVNLTGADASNYSVASAPNTTANITSLGLSAISSAADKVYDGNTNAVVTITLDGVVSGDVVTGSAPGSFADKYVGTIKLVSVGAVTLAGTDAGNYSVGSAPTATASITPKGLTATSSAANKIYDGNTNASVTIGLVGVVGSDAVAGSATGTFDTKNVGTNKPVTVGSVSLTGLDAGNYSVGSAPNTTADIVQKALTVTSSASDKVYDGNDSATVSIGLVGVVSGDSVTGSASGTFDTKNVGSGKTVSVGSVSLSGGDAGNYSVTSAPTTTASITAKSLTASATAADKVYDGNTAATVTISLGGVVSGDAVSGSATGTFGSKVVGTGKTVTLGTISLAGVDAGNYSVGTATNPTASITPKALTATSSASNKIYDGTNTASLTIGLNGVVSGDTVSGAAAGTFADKNVGVGKTVTGGPIVLSGTDAGNYTAGTAPNSSADIVAKTLSILADAKSKIVGDVDPALTYSSIGLVSGDAISGSLTRTAGETVGVYSILLGSVTAGSNYAITFSTASFTILPSAPPVTLTSVTVNGGDSYFNPSQRSMITSLVVTFSVPVTIAANAFSITNIGLFTASSTPLAQSQILVSGSGNTYTIRFGAGAGVISRVGTGSRGNSLADGNYVLSIDRTKVSGTVGNLSGNNTFGAAAVDGFYRMFGDGDGNGTVDNADSFLVRSALTVGNAQFGNAAFDVNGDSSLSSAEVAGPFAPNFNKRRRLF